MRFRLPYKIRAIEKQPRNKYIHFIRYKLDCIFENLYIKNAALPSMGVRQYSDDGVKIIVSLTSYPQRMEQTYFAIKSLMLQSLQADRIILWLAEPQFPEHKLPNKFEELCSRGLEVRFVPEDLRSHKKYFYALQEQQPNEVVITFDDDLIYEWDAVEKVYRKHKEYPECIICNRGQTIVMGQDCKIAPYSQWQTNSDEGVASPSLMVMPSTGAGCLYPYGIMPETTFDVEAIRKHAFTADDIWMKFNSLQCNTRVIKTLKDNAMLCTVNDSQRTHLGEVNCMQGTNDKVVAALLNLFPQSLSMLHNS